MTDPAGHLTPAEERAMMLALATGDERALRALYARFASTVFGLGLRMLRTTEAAEELTQDVFLAAWRKAARYDAARGRLSTWLMAIAHNLAVDRLRRKPAPTPSATLEEVAAIGISEEDELVDREDVRRVLEALSAAERRLLLLAYFGGLTSREIAERERLPIGTVKTRMRTVLIKLRRTHRKEPSP